MLARMASPSAQYSLTIRVEIGNKPGMLGRVAGAIGEAGGVIGAVDIVDLKDDKLIREIKVDAAGPEQWGAITGALDAAALRRQAVGEKHKSTRPSAGD